MNSQILKLEAPYNIIYAGGRIGRHIATMTVWDDDEMGIYNACQYPMIDEGGELAAGALAAEAELGDCRVICNERDPRVQLRWLAEMVKYDLEQEEPVEFSYIWERLSLLGVKVIWDKARDEKGETIVSQLDTGKEIKRLKDLQDLPSTIAPKYRKGEKAEQLVMIIREVNTRVENDENWNWALVMKVMLDEGLLMTNIPNKFDRLMLSMIPGKGVDTVRKSGDYSVIEERRSWHRWISNPNDDWKEAANRTVCEEIYAYFRPLL